MKTGFHDAYPALPAALGAVAGVVSVDYPWFWAVAGLVFAIMVFVRVRFVPALLFILMATLTSVIALRMESVDLDDSVFDGRTRLWTGIVESVRSSDRSQRCVLVFDRPVVMRCRLTLADITPNLRPGDIIEVEGVAESSGKYSGAPLLAYSGDRSERTDANMLVMQRSCRITGHSGSLWYRLQDLRHTLAEYVYESPLKASTARLLAASVFGGGDVGDDRKEAFRSSGLSHLLCVSGFHVAVFAIVLAALLFPLKVGERIGRSRYLIVIFAVWIYAALTGLMPSVFRAAVMLSVYNMACFFQRNSPPFNSLCVAVSIILAINPLWVFSIGFQLSVSAVLGLLVFSDKFNPVRRGHRLYGAFALFAVPLAATVATAPVLLWHFHTLPLLAVPANALASLVFPLFMISGCIVVFLSAIGLRLGFAAGCVDRLAEFIDRICNISMLWTNPDGIMPGVFEMLLMCACICLLAVILHATGLRHKLILLSVGLLLAFTAVIAPEKVQARDIAVHGNAFSSEIRVRCSGRGCIVPLSGGGRAMGNPENYFLDGGVPLDRILIATDSMDIGEVYMSRNILSMAGVQMLIAANDSSAIAGKVDILLLKGRYRGCLDSLLTRHNPSTVIIAADMDPDRRESYALTANNAGLNVCDLTREVFIQDF